MRALRGHLCFLLLLSLPFGLPLAAQTLPSPEIEQEAIRQADLNARRRAVESFTPQALPGSTAQNRPKKAGRCFLIKTIKIEGVSILKPIELAQIRAPYNERCLTGGDIQALMQDIDAHYATAGYITAKTYVAPQNIASGKITLQVIEGEVEELVLQGKDGEPRQGGGTLTSAFPKVIGAPLRLQDFEQGLDQMNRLGSVEAQMRLEPGLEPGGSRVVITRIQEDRLRMYVHTDNQNSKAAGINSMRFSLEVDDLFGLNDAWTAGLSSTRNTNAIDLSGSVPYGYTTFNWRLGHSEYLTPLTEASELFGTSTTGSLGLTHLMHRDQDSLTTLKTTLSRTHLERAINHASLAPQDLAVLAFDLQKITTGQGWREALNGGIKLGLAGFGAGRDAPNIGLAVARHQFIKLESGYYRQTSLERFGTLINDLRVQYSPAALFSAEQIALGSYATVRGFRESKATGDMGIYLRNDLHLPFKGEGAWQGLRHWAFFDGGATYDHALRKTAGIAGAGYGVSYENDILFGEAALAVPVVSRQYRGLRDLVLWVNMKVKVF